MLLAVDQRLLDPHRPLEEPSAAEKEEGLIRYSPLLPLLHRHVLSHRRLLPRVRWVHSAPAAMESATLVTAGGLDLFATKSAPSREFDVLGPGISRPLILGLVLGATALTVVTNYLLRRKRLQQAWM